MDNMNPNPVTIINTDVMGIIAIGINEKQNGAFVTIITAISNINDMMKFKNSDKTLPNIKICFGEVVICKMVLFPLIEFIDTPIAPLKKSKIHFADKKYTGKLSIFPPKTVENMIVNIAIINNGFNMLQNIPKTESLYFDAKFFLTISSSKKNSFLFIKFMKIPL